MLLNTPVAGVADGRSLRPLPGFNLNQKGAPMPYSSYPVLYWGGYTYWPAAFDDRRLSIAVLAFDPAGTVVFTFEATGARGIVDVRVNATARMITFTGEEGRTTNPIQWTNLLIAPQLLRFKYPGGQFPALASQSSAGEEFVPIKSEDNKDYQCLSAGGYTYWPAHSLRETKSSAAIIVTAPNGAVIDVHNLPVSSAITDLRVEPQQVDCTTSNGIEVSLPIDAFRHSYTRRFEFAAFDIIQLADFLGLPFVTSEALQMAQSLDGLTADNMRAAIARVGSDTSLQTSWNLCAPALGAFILAGLAPLLLGHGVGILLFGVAGFMVDFENNGSCIPALSSKYAAQGDEASQTFSHYDRFPVDPFRNHLADEDLWHLFKYKSYGRGLKAAAALARPDPKKPTILKGFYPTDRTYRTELDHGSFGSGTLFPDPHKIYDSNYTQGIEIWQFIFVIVSVPSQLPGKLAFQLCFHPEAMLLHPPHRPNHSWLTDDWRLERLLGDETKMQVWAAGIIRTRVSDGSLYEIGTQTGHYYRDFEGQDARVLEAVRDFIAGLGYDVTGLRYVDRSHQVIQLPSVAK